MHIEKRILRFKIEREGIERFWELWYNKTKFDE